MPRRSAASAVCPRPGHEGSRVRFDGTYGSPGHRRQRYKCTPANGDEPHVFTDVLPREQAWRDACEACERHVAAHEGPQAPREHLFVARGIAQTPVAVGSAVLKREGLGKRSRLEPPEPVNRYERKRAGELVHIDVKKLGRIQGGPGKRVTGRRERWAPTRTDAAGNRRQLIGWEFVHVASTTSPGSPTSRS